MQGTDQLIFPSCGRHCSQVSPDSILHCKLSYYKLPLLSWLVALERNFYLCNRIKTKKLTPNFLQLYSHI
jgi:hypothetical protein